MEVCGTHYRVQHTSAEERYVGSLRPPVQSRTQPDTLSFRVLVAFAGHADEFAAASGGRVPASGGIVQVSGLSFPS